MKFYFSLNNSFNNLFVIEIKVKNCGINYLFDKRFRAINRH